jgi:hypothetical protein
MEITFTHILTIAMFLLGFIITYFIVIIRNDQKLLHSDEKIRSLEAEVSKLSGLIDQHRLDQNIHFQEKTANQVQIRTNEKFAELKEQVSKMENNFTEKFRELKQMFQVSVERTK